MSLSGQAAASPREGAEVKPPCLLTVFLSLTSTAAIASVTIAGAGHSVDIVACSTALALLLVSATATTGCCCASSTTARHYTTQCCYQCTELMFTDTAAQCSQRVLVVVKSERIVSKVGAVGIKLDIALLCAAVE